MEASAEDSIADLFRREFAHLVSALARLLGPSKLALAEDVVQDALLSAMQAWRFGIPEHPRAWLLTVAKRRAIDLLRRERRLGELTSALELDGSLRGEVELALSPEADAANQLAMMFALCDPSLAAETHITLILKFLCGFSAAEIARAFLVDVQTIDRRLHRGRARLEEAGALREPTSSAPATHASVERALYLLFNEGYHGTGSESPLHPAMCGDAIRLAEMLIAGGNAARSAHALAALFCFVAARMNARLDDEGVILPLAEQDRSRWDRALIARGVMHLGESAGDAGFTRWHLEAGIAWEHTSAPSVEATDWARILHYYDALSAIAPGPIVALNRALAIAEVRGLAAGRDALSLLAGEPKLARYSFYWAARADIERRSGHHDAARELYRRAAELAASRAERASYERRIHALVD
jgi:RNA polymerase sigma factor (sigma-70 family)